MKKILIATISLIIIIIIIISYIIYDTEKNLVKNHINKTIIIDIPKKTNLSQVIDKLNEQNEFIPKFKYFLIMKYYTKFYNKYLIAGTYKFEKGFSYYQVINSLFNGTNQYLIKVTYPEGITYKQFAEITEKHFNIPAEQFINYVNSEKVLKKYGIQAPSIEGYLYPSTYKFKPNIKLEQIVDKLITTFKQIWYKNFENQAQRLTWSMHKVITLASIIEAESPIIEERKRISGVYHNRIKKGMLLQADPTVQYALNGKKRLLYKDLKINSPYNTYKFIGLPPGPINSPGFTSIEAALNPEKHNFIYFVAKGDGSERHNFSESFIKHQKFIKAYRKNQRKN